MLGLRWGALAVVAWLGCSSPGIPGEVPDAGEDAIPDPDPDPDPVAPHEKLFSRDYLPVYRITMEGMNWQGAWDYLVAQLDPVDKCAPRPFVSVDLEFDNPWTGEIESYEQVAFRIRGHDLPDQFVARPDERWGFKMSFVEYVQGRRFHGHRRINFLSSERDDSLLRQCLGHSLMRDFGVPSPRCNHAMIYVNGEYIGVFAHVEERDDRGYAKNRFPDDPDGNLYEAGDCHGSRDDTLAYLGPDPDSYLETYQLEGGTPPEAITTDLLPFLECADGPAEWFADCIGDHIYVDEWHRAIASQFALPDMDGWMASQKGFLLYGYGPRGADRRFVVFPWDIDRSFKDDCSDNDALGDNHTGPCHILGRTWQDGTSPEVVNRLREPPFRQNYCSVMRAFLDEQFNPAAMRARIADQRGRPRQLARPFDGLEAPTLDQLFQRDPLWTFERFDEDVQELIEDRFDPRYAALVDQLVDCETAPLVDN